MFSRRWRNAHNNTKNSTITLFALFINWRYYKSCEQLRTSHTHTVLIVSYFRNCFSRLKEIKKFLDYGRRWWWCRGEKGCCSGCWLHRSRGAVKKFRNERTIHKMGPEFFRWICSPEFSKVGKELYEGI